jgi:hypothetical protein
LQETRKATEKDLKETELGNHIFPHSQRHFSVVLEFANKQDLTLLLAALRKQIIDHQELPQEILHFEVVTG